MELNTMEDWEKWAALARENPEQFERERRAAIEAAISSQTARTQKSSRQLQWKIDAVRRTAPSNLAACIRIYDMLMESFYGPGGLLQAINQLDGRTVKPELFDMPAAKAGRRLEFRRGGSPRNNASPS